MKISVILEALTGSFSTDMARASKDAQKRMRELEKSVKESGKAIGQAFALAATATAAFVKVQADAIAQYKDLGQKIGDTASNVSKLADAAGKSDTSLDSLVSASVRLSATLSKLDDDSKGAGEAIAALGINFEDFKKLAAVDRLDAVAKAMAGFEDSTSKTAAAVAIFGKSGAELLPFLAEFAAESQHVARVTDEQSEAADRFNDILSDSSRISDQYRNALANGMLPVFGKYIEGLNKSADGTSRLSEATKIGATWARGLTSAFIIVKGVMNAVGTAVANVAASISLLFKGVSLADMGNPVTMFYAMSKNAKAVLSTLKTGVGDITEGIAQEMIDLGKLFDRNIAPVAEKAKALREQLKFDPKVPGGKGSAAKDIAAARIELLEMPSAIDSVTVRATAMSEAVAEIAPQFEDATVAATEAASAMSVAWDEATRSMQSALADFLFDPFKDGLKGMLKSFGETLRRMAADAAAAQIMDAVLGKQGKDGGRTGGWIEWAMQAWSAYNSGGGKAMGGPVFAGTSYMVGERGPEMFVPKVSGDIVPNHKMGGVSQYFSVTVMAPEGRISRASDTQLRQTLGSAVAGSMRRNG